MLRGLTWRLLLTATLLGLVFADTSLAKGPELSAKAAVLIDADSGEVLYQRSADKRLAIASTTKMMTALVAVENLSLNDRLRTAAYSPLPAETVVGLRPGERMRVRDLLTALMLPSANDAAVTLAVGTSGSVSAFVKQMNGKAAQLGLKRTRFSTPVGLDRSGNYSTAEDLATLAQEVLKNPFLASVVKRERAKLGSGTVTRTVTNRNTLLSKRPGLEGVKTGHTLQAGYVLVAAERRRGENSDGLRLISVVLGTPSEAARNSDTAALLDYGFDSFKIVTPIKKGEVIGQLAMERGSSVAKVPAEAKDGFSRLVTKGSRVLTNVKLSDKSGESRVQAGDLIGVATVTVDGQAVKSIPLLATIDARPAGATQSLKDFFYSRSALIFTLELVITLAIFLIVTLLLPRQIHPFKRVLLLAVIYLIINVVSAMLFKT